MKTKIEKGLQPVDGVISLLGNHNGIMDDDLYDMLEETHPHSTPEYVEWMANVWRLNDERNKKLDMDI
jgi:hypothetical protein